MKKYQPVIYTIIIIFLSSVYIPILSFATDDTSEVCIFRDVCSDHWAFSAIEWLSTNQIISGYPDFTFKPDKTVTKEEFATILSKTFKLNTQNFTSNSPYYLDISKNRWSYPFIESTKTYLLNFKNNTSTKFFPKQEMLREDVTVAIIKILNLNLSEYKSDNLDIFKDKALIPQKYYTYISAAVDENIIAGYPIENSNLKLLKPQNTVTRAELSALLYSIWKNTNFIKE